MYTVKASLYYTSSPTEQSIFYTDSSSVANVRLKYTWHCQVGSLN